ncbi:tRNA G18 (ribose-2'-O)-methylase SpoU [Neomicrococcus aestuarii]|uniref:tRNA G18 (Ribose-2'-O)-methylase SpoU n=1 Tax=Neomicrococcus aestuarii TaxID=556325 RepID=A0A7W8X0L9_9MICC|nr:RNA methyltransferase [Neomicrococcus aestuarii]MBB5511849.1 tRNA G18 (ribose-2'-O)-methylase SpoU [Neomicrococcus aestuarii]
MTTSFLPPNVVHLENADDPRVADYVALSDAALRQKRDPEQGIYIAESTNVVKRAIAAGHTPRSFFLTEKWLPKLSEEIARFPEVPVLMGSPEILAEIAGFHLHRGALAAMNRPAIADVADILTGAKRVAILEGLTDHTNVGAIFRNAAAIGVGAVLISPQCADPLYRRSIRVSMGTVFQIPWARVQEWPEGLEKLKEAGFFLAGMSLGEDSITLDQLIAKRSSKLALIFGTEGDGLTTETDRLLDARVTIPMMNGVDSLNVAASSAVAFYMTR